MIRLSSQTGCLTLVDWSTCLNSRVEFLHTVCVRRSHLSSLVICFLRRVRIRKHIATATCSGCLADEDVVKSGHRLESTLSKLIVDRSGCSGSRSLGTGIHRTRWSYVGPTCWQRSSPGGLTRTTYARTCTRLWNTVRIGGFLICDRKTPMRLVKLSIKTSAVRQTHTLDLEDQLLE